MEKNNKKELLKKYKAEKNNEFISSLPFGIEVFDGLFDYIDCCMEDYECNHTLLYTITFLKENNLNLEALIEWLEEHGGYCDCEVLANIEEKILEI